MMKTDYYITDKTDIFVYFEIIRQLGAASVLDVGLFLKRIGAVSRQVGDMELPDGIVLDGLELYDGPGLPIYDVIYDRIYHSLSDVTKHDVAMIMYAPVETDIKRIAKNVKMIFADEATYVQMMSCGLRNSGVQDVTVESYRFKLVTI